MERSSYSSKTEARSREREAPSDRTRRSVEEPVREDSVLIEYNSHVQRAVPGHGRGEKSKNPNQRPAKKIRSSISTVLSRGKHTARSLNRKDSIPTL